MFGFIMPLNVIEVCRVLMATGRYDIFGVSMAFEMGDEF